MSGKILQPPAKPKVKTLRQFYCEKFKERGRASCADCGQTVLFEVEDGVEVKCNCSTWSLSVKTGKDSHFCKLTRVKEQK